MTESMMKTVLIVDDDHLMRRSLTATLDQAGYRAAAAASAEEALDALRLATPDLILLDIGLPGIDGLEALREVRRLAPRLPVIFLTARRRELDEIVGLELGADDYITKPFDMDVLLAHIKAVLRRAPARSANGADDTLTVGAIRIDPAARAVWVNDKPVALAPKEFDLLHLLGRNAGRVLGAEELLQGVWGADWVGESQTLYVHIRWLREKIEDDPADPRRLVTLRGAGYKLVAA